MESEEALLSRREVLRQVAKAAGDCLRQHYGNTVQIRHKGDINLVTQADNAAEAVVIEAIAKAFPSDTIVAEESGRCQGSNEWHWVIDPLDGTTNFASSLPHFAVSIGLVHKGEILAGVVFDPIKNDWFEGCKGEGAFLNGKPIGVSQKKDLGQALTATGFPYDRRQRMPALLQRAENILMCTRGLRRLGAAALDLAYVACGRLDIFLEDGLNSWDIAAGLILVREAGGEVLRFDGNPACLEKGEVVAANPFLSRQALARLI